MFEAFTIGPFLLWSRAIFLLLGIWLSAEFFFKLADSARLSLKNFQEYALYFIGAFIVSGRFFAVLSQYKIYVLDPLRIFTFTDGGFSYIGAVFGIAVVLYFVTKQQRTTFLQ